MIQLGKIAKGRIEQIKIVQRFLRHAVWTFASGGKSDGVSDEVRALANPWANSSTRSSTPSSSKTCRRNSAEKATMPA